jgi:hypothetical protein
MSAPVVWLALLPLVAGRLRLVRRRTLVIGVVLGALLYIPFAVSEARTGFGNTRAFVAETLGGGAGVGRNASAATNFTALLAPVYTLRFLTLDVSYHELSGYWGGLNEGAAWHALWYGSDARPFHPLRLAALLASIALVVVCAVVAGRDAWRRRIRERAAPGGGWRTVASSAFALAALVAVAGTVLLLGLTSKQIFAHYVTPTMPFAFVLFAAAARSAFADPAARRLRPLLVGLAVIVCAGGIEATLSISRRIDGRNGLAVHRAVAQRLLDDCAAAGRPPQACPARLDFGFVAMPSTHAIFARHALAQPLRWEHTAAGFAYRLQKRTDPPPPQAAAFPVTAIGPVNLYRSK